MVELLAGKAQAEKSQTGNIQAGAQIEDQTQQEPGGIGVARGTFRTCLETFQRCSGYTIKTSFLQTLI